MIPEEPPAEPPPASPPGQTPRMSNATRYLCAGAYLDSTFRNRTLEETTLHEFRAVPPSFGFDLGPVIQHCIRARRMLIGRDALIAGILLLGLIISFSTTVWWLVLLVPFALLASARTRGRNSVTRSMVKGLWGVLMLIGVILFPFLFVPYLLDQFDGPSSSYDFETGELLIESPFATLGELFVTLLIPIATVLVALGYRVFVYRTLAGTLRPGAASPSPTAENARTRRRLEHLQRAQWGNITLYADENPFMGSGKLDRIWSIAVELDRKRASSPGSPGKRTEQPIDIDPVELHAFVRDRLSQMRTAVLRPNESVDRLVVGDHVVARGVFSLADRAGDGRYLNVAAHPLIDQQTGLPRHQATAEEIKAIIRHPQGGVRYYQRIVVGNQTQEIRDEAGRLVAPAEDQEVTTSAFIYLAVEGRMLYTQFVVTVLPPVANHYHVVDDLPRMTPARIAWEAVKAVKLHMLRDIVAALPRLIRTGLQLARERATAKEPSESLVYPYGAVLSVRELGAARDLQTYMQALDVTKYTKLIEQRLTEAVLDFLEERDVDTTGYRQRAAEIVNNHGVMMSGGTISGPFSVGSNAKATQHNAARST
ncbi:hypothetical protein [Rhizohabitans arisaemae]|uniref:hypothetical protein n=1 Tax=Rhizohabitans arisaemae TaxID=2720610 RepID=UPI0024B1DFF0|nr:hypothetical protein [Rhizohabitans arisaemae]